MMGIMTRRTGQFAAVLMTLLGLAACQPADKAGEASPASKTAWSGPPLPVQTIGIQIAPEAMAILDRFDNKLQIGVAYYGLPKPGTTAKTNERHELEMGHDVWLVKRTTTSVTLSGEGLDATLLPETTDGQVYYKISANGVNASNISNDYLECSLARGTMTRPQTNPKTITCTLPRP